MRWTALVNWLALFVLHFAGVVATADDAASEPATQSEQIAEIVRAAVVVTRGVETASRVLNAPPLPDDGESDVPPFAERLEIEAVDDESHALPDLWGDDREAHPAAALHTLVRGLFSEDEIVSCAAAAALNEIDQHPAFLGVTPWGQAGVSIEDPRAIALIQATRLSIVVGGDDEALWRWCRARIQHDSADMRKAAASSAMAGDPAESILFLQQLARDEDAGVRLCAVHHLGGVAVFGSSMGFSDYSQFAANLVQEAVGDSDPQIRDTAFEILSTLIGFVLEDMPDYILPEMSRMVSRPGGESPYLRKLIAMSESDARYERATAVYSLMFFHPQTEETTRVIVNFVESAASELESTDLTTLVASQPYPDAPWQYPNLNGIPDYETLEAFDEQTYRLLSIALTTPEGVTAAQRLRHALLDDQILRARCNISLLRHGHVTWDECRDEVLAACEDEDWFTRELIGHIVWTMDETTAATIVADFDSHLGTHYLAELTGPNRDRMSLGVTFDLVNMPFIDQISELDGIDWPSDTEAVIELLSQEWSPESLETPLVIFAVLERLADAESNADGVITAVMNLANRPYHDRYTPFVQAQAIRCLGHIATADNAEAAAALRHHLRTGGLSIRTEAAFALARMGIVDDEVLSELAWLESNGPFHLREQYSAVLDSLATSDGSPTRR